jgi:hypothetical protein
MREPCCISLPFTLRKIKWIDERIALPGFGGLLLTGLAMGFMVMKPGLWS